LLQSLERRLFSIHHCYAASIAYTKLDGTIARRRLTVGGESVEKNTPRKSLPCAALTLAQGKGSFNPRR
jgi:hypothetical protein